MDVIIERADWRPVFERIAATDGLTKGLLSADALAGYVRPIGRDVTADEVSSVLTEVTGANIVMRRGHGLYGLTDPFVQQIWWERARLSAPPDAAR